MTIKYIGENKNETCFDFDNDSYLSQLEKLIDESGLPNKGMLMMLFAKPSSLSISTYRKYLAYLATDEWEKFRSSRPNLYDGFSNKICAFLSNHSVDYTVKVFEKELKIIAEVTNKSFDQIVTLFNSYYINSKIKNPLALSAASAAIKTLIRSFNGKSKELYISKYINHNVEYIKPYFQCSVDINKNKCSKLEIDQFLNIVIDNDELRNTFKILIEDKLGFTVDNTELCSIITNVLNDDDIKNLNFFNITTPRSFKYFDITTSYNRLVQNYLPKIKEQFSKDKLELINSFIKSSSEKRKDLRKNFTKSQLLLLNEIIPILKESNSFLDIQNDEFSIISNSSVLNIDELHEAKVYRKIMSNYNNIHNFISKTYYLQCKALKNILDESKPIINLSKLPFTDDNYLLKNADYLFDFELFDEILSKLDPNKISKYSIGDNNFLALKKLLIDEGLLAATLVNRNNISLVVDIINNLSFINKGKSPDKIGIYMLNGIAKQAHLYNFIDDFTFAILGQDVTEKIAFNNQFLQGKNTPDEIKCRLRKAVDLMIRAQDIDSSAIPYFDKVTVDNVSLQRYYNNDPKLLTSGIDSNTCFKISGNDNDYLFYSVLNKNGMAAMITFNDEMIGRITAHRFSNVLMINGVRSSNNDYQATSFEQLKLNNSMIDVVEKFAKEVIALTTSSDCPVDFVVCNKAGILEAPEYDNKFMILPEHLFTNPIDCYHEDFVKFKTLYDDEEEQFLQETINYPGGNVAPFTTDFGHYPVVLIASRDGKQLNRRWDITVNSPNDCYIRPNISYSFSSMDSKTTAMIYRIDALNFVNSGNDPSTFSLNNYDNYKVYFVTDSDYCIYNDEGDFINKCCGNRDNLKLEKVKSKK